MSEGSGRAGGRESLVGALLVALSCGTSAQEGSSGTVVVVRVSNEAGLDESALVEANQIAAHVLGRAGVQAEWCSCRPYAGREGCAACSKRTGVVEISIRILTGPQLGGRSGGDRLGWAEVPKDGIGNVAFIRSGRLGALAHSSLTSVPVILGHLEAHEIGHLLLGPRAHSLEGIMRRNWTRYELEQAAYGRLTFTRDQARQLQVRMAHLVPGILIPPS
jgi:hypothetical protein